MHLELWGFRDIRNVNALSYVSNWQSMGTTKDPHNTQCLSMPTKI